MEFLFTEIFFSIIGWIYLWIRYRKKAKLEKALLDKYDNSYSVAGSMLYFKSFLIVFLILIVLLILIAIFSIFKFGIS